MKKDNTQNDIRSLFDIPKGTICSKCKKHKATVNWVGEGGTVALVHGQYSRWCNCCAVKEQLRYAEEAAKQIEGLKAKLQKKCKDMNI